ncbi:MAG: SDR family oxidoreductase [Magnetococcales bacterium]|nr:SDR family oxidoreductase [Magnetococcales bacterium]
MALPTMAVERGVALVIGGGNRLGALIARDLSAAGWALAVTYHQSGSRTAHWVAEVVAAGGVARCYPLDLRHPFAITSILADVHHHWGPVTLLINNAGVFLPDHLLYGAEEGWRHMESLFKVTLQGPLWLSMQVAQAMRQAQVSGQIITIADIWGERPLSGYAAYGAAKAGMIMATQVLARDWAPTIRVNAILPGAVLPPEEENPGYQRLLERTPLKDQAGWEGVCQAVRYLLSARFVTGEILHVDGGRHLV